MFVRNNAYRCRTNYNPTRGAIPLMAEFDRPEGRLFTASARSIHNTFKGLSRIDDQATEEF